MSNSKGNRYRVVFRRKAELGLHSAYNYIYERNPLKAKAWANTLFAAIETLQESPQRCALAPESRQFGVEIRQLLVGKRGRLYRVLFTIEDMTISVISIRHTSQDLLGPEDYYH